mmetsp:Transcript_30110/g.70214  ORF Transcript_30110/g.70214 Transcript_30110/m.70214 type:complete len:204 (-) Transcript_30110:217-828(-)
MKLARLGFCPATLVAASATLAAASAEGTGRAGKSERRVCQWSMSALENACHSPSFTGCQLGFAGEVSADRALCGWRASAEQCSRLPQWALLLLQLSLITAMSAKNLSISCSCSLSDSHSFAACEVDVTAAECLEQRGGSDRRRCRIEDASWLLCSGGETEPEKGAQLGGTGDANAEGGRALALATLLKAGGGVLGASWRFCSG